MGYNAHIPHSQYLYLILKFNDSIENPEEHLQQGFNNLSETEWDNLQKETEILFKGKNLYCIEPWFKTDCKPFLEELCPKNTKIVISWQDLDFEVEDDEMKDKYGHSYGSYYFIGCNYLDETQKRGNLKVIVEELCKDLTILLKKYKFSEITVVDIECEELKLQ